MHVCAHGNPQRESVSGLGCGPGVKQHTLVGFAYVGTVLLVHFMHSSADADLLTVAGCDCRCIHVVHAVYVEVCALFAICTEDGGTRFRF